MRKETKKKIQRTGVILFAVYLLFLTYFLFFAESLGRELSQREYSYNLHLFREIRRFVEYRETLGMEALILNVCGNVFCFLPFGGILPVMNRKFRSCLRVAALSLAFSLLVEMIQLLSRRGSFDVDDLLLNTIGGILGYLIFYICNCVRRKHYG